MPNLPSSAFLPIDGPTPNEERISELESENAELRRQLAATAPSVSQMDFARAHQINSAMCACQFAALRSSDGIPAWLAEVPLGDLIESARIVKDDGKSAFPDDRLIAAVYTLLHYHPGNTIVSDGRGKPAVIRSFREHGAV
jgi:hypothetical protein